jgi:hypothetical protein
MSNSVEMDCVVASIDMLLDSIRALSLAREELKVLRTNKGNEIKVDFVVKTEQGESIGVRSADNGVIEFIPENPESAGARTTINMIKQSYARIKILSEVKGKGYKSVKEEKLADGSIRLVVQKWQ